MSEVILKIENLSKQYRLGLVGRGTLRDDLTSWWYKIRGKGNPFLKIGEENDRATAGKSDYVWALQDINIEVKRGEVLGIIGKNGAGKSTLLKILSKVTGPSTGTIKSRGRIASLLEVGTGFHGEMTGKENIFLNGAILGMAKKEIREKYDEIVEFSGCKRYIDTPVKRYSSGMTVRLAFAVAAFLEPDILVIDEVLAVGDAEFQEKAIGKMKEVSRGEGRTVLFVSHNMAAIKTLCTRALVLENGGIIFKGSPGDAINEYISKSNFQEEKPLIERTDRIGNGKILVRDVQFLNNEGKEIYEAISGKFLKLKISILKKEIINYSNLIVSIAFQNRTEETILLFRSDEMGYNFSEMISKDNFVLTIPKLFLRGSKYHIRIVMTEGKPGPDNFLDIINNAAFLNVLDSDFFDNGRLTQRFNQAIIPGVFQV